MSIQIANKPNVLTRLAAMLDEFATYADEESWPEDLDFEFGHLRLQLGDGRLS